MSLILLALLLFGLLMLARVMSGGGSGGEAIINRILGRGPTQSFTITPPPVPVIPGGGSGGARVYQL